jgi:addiction module RelE/StbE family toxin
MKLKFTKEYHKQFAKLRRNEKIRVQACLGVFLLNPDSPSLGRHALKGKYQGTYSISAGGDLRLHYYEEGDNITFVFVRVGSHSRLYG